MKLFFLLLFLVNCGTEQPIEPEPTPQPIVICHKQCVKFTCTKVCE